MRALIVNEVETGLRIKIGRKIIDTSSSEIVLASKEFGKSFKFTQPKESVDEKLMQLTWMIGS